MLFAQFYDASLDYEVECHDATRHGDMPGFSAHTRLVTMSGLHGGHYFEALLQY